MQYVEVSIRVPRLPGLKNSLISKNRMWTYIVKEFVDRC